MINDILEQWKNEKIVIHIIEEADLKLESNEGFSAYSIVKFLRNSIYNAPDSMDMMVKLNMDNNIMEDFDVEEHINNISYMRIRFLVVLCMLNFE